MEPMRILKTQNLMGQPTHLKEKQKMFRNVLITNSISLIVGPETCCSPYRNSFFDKDELARDYARASILNEKNKIAMYTPSVWCIFTSASASTLILAPAIAVAVAK